MINRRNKENSKLVEKKKRILHGLISARNFRQLEEICIEKFGKTTTITMRYFLPLLCGIGSSYIGKKAIKTSIISIGIIGYIYFMLNVCGSETIDESFMKPLKGFIDENTDQINLHKRLQQLHIKFKQFFEENTIDFSLFSCGYLFGVLFI